jgi:hypothetical protein
LFCDDSPSRLPWTLESKRFAGRVSAQSTSNRRFEQARQAISLHGLEVNACTIVDARGGSEPSVISQLMVRIGSVAETDSLIELSKALFSDGLKHYSCM